MCIRDSRERGLTLFYKSDHPYCCPNLRILQKLLLHCCVLFLNPQIIYLHKQMMQPKPLHILISPLDWGLGHASRCIPLIRHLIKSGQTVTLAGAGRSLHMLQLEFPNLKSIEIPGFSPTYSRSGNTLLHLFLLLPAFLKSLFSEHRSLQKILKTENPDIVISDNRYGFRHKSVKSILITHQAVSYTHLDVYKRQ